MSTEQTNVLLAPFTRTLRIRTGEDNGKPADGLGALDVAHAQALTDFDRARDLTAQRHLTANTHHLVDYCDITHCQELQECKERTWYQTLLILKPQRM